MGNEENIKSDRAKELVESMEKMKEVQRIQYDYFKHLTTLNAGSIGIAVAFISRLSSASHCFALAILSLLSFFSGIIVALCGMIAAGNAIQYTCGIRVIWAAQKNDPEEAVKRVEEMQIKFDTMLDRIHVYDKFTMIALVSGILMFLLYMFAK